MPAEGPPTIRSAQKIRIGATTDSQTSALWVRGTLRFWRGATDLEVPGSLGWRGPKATSRRRAELSGRQSRSVSHLVLRYTSMVPPNVFPGEPIVPFGAVIARPVSEPPVCADPAGWRRPKPTARG